METGGIVVTVLVTMVVLITSSVLLGVSFDTIEPWQYGLKINMNTMHIHTDRLYEEGRYLVGLGQKFVVFPRYIRTLKFGNVFKDNNGGTLDCRTSEGLVIELDITFQYKLNPVLNDIVRLYTDFAEDYEAAFSNIARSVIRDVASKYSVFDFFENRQTVADDCQATLGAALADVYASVTSFQLYNVQINSRLADAIVATQVEYQIVQQTQFQQNKLLIETDAQVQVARQLANVTLIQAQATADSNFRIVQSQANALLTRVQKQIDGLLDVRASLGLNSSEALLSYLWLVAIQENGASNLNVNIKPPNILTRAGLFN